jgi:hypothetical protein
LKGAVKAPETAETAKNQPDFEAGSSDMRVKQCFYPSEDV